MRYSLLVVLLIGTTNLVFAQKGDVSNNDSQGNSVKTDLDSLPEISNLKRIDTLISRTTFYFNETIHLPVNKNKDRFKTLTFSGQIELRDTTFLPQPGPYSYLLSPPPDTLTIIGVGDIMMGTNYPDESNLPPKNGSMLLEEVTPYLQDAEITFGNLEAAIGDEGGNPKNCNNPKYCYTFRMPTSYLSLLKKAGFDLLSTANNHVNDFGYSGRQISRQVLNEAEIPYAGFDSEPYTYVVHRGITYGMAAFAPHSGTMSIFDLKKAKEIVRMLDETSDVVIVSFHAGAEGSSHQHLTKQTEIFLGANRGNVYQFSRDMIDAGADIIFGHGPHVTRAVDLYKNRFIAYSLGNFCTYRKFNLSGVNGYAPIIKVFTDRDGTFIKADVISIKQDSPGGPEIDYGQNAFRIIKNLTEEDLPEAPLYFTEGSIFPRPNSEK